MPIAFTAEQREIAEELLQYAIHGGARPKQVPDVKLPPQSWEEDPDSARPDPPRLFAVSHARARTLFRRDPLRHVRGSRLVDAALSVLALAKGVAFFALLGYAAHRSYELMYGPRRKTPRPVRTGQPY